MVLGRRPKKRSQDLWTPTDQLPRSPGHPFYRKLNEILLVAEFDRYVEDLCESYYATGKGRPSIPPGVYFRMLFLGYFEGIDSQRGIAWRCADSMSVREFLGLAPTQKSPDHSSLTVIRKRLPVVVHEEVFAFVVRIAEERGLAKGKRIAVDSTMLEANAAMKSIVRRDTGENWKEYVKRLAQEAGIEDPSDEDARRFDKGRKDKKVSNKDWKSKTDPSSEIGKMKDGRTHLSYKAEHALDLDSELLLSARITRATESDANTLVPTVLDAQANLIAAGSDVFIEEVVADKGYHATETLTDCADHGIRTYIPERRSSRRRKWKRRPAEQRTAVINNRRRVRRAYSKKLQRMRSEKVERSFAHNCETGGSRRTWLRGLEDIAKRYVIHSAGRNLGRIMFLMFGIGTPRGLQLPISAASAGLRALADLSVHMIRSLKTITIPDWIHKVRTAFSRMEGTRPDRWLEVA